MVAPDPEMGFIQNADRDPMDRKTEIEYHISQLSARDPRMRSQAAKRLGELHAGAEPLLIALKDPNPYVRSAAADALGFATGAEPGEINDRLMEAIDDPNDYVCASAIHSLGILHVELSSPQIETCLDDPNPLVIQAAILALGRLGANHLGERIAGFLDHPHYLVRLSAARAVALLGYTAAGSRLIDNLLELVQQRDGMDFKLPKAYIESLSRLKVMEAIPLLIRIAQDEIGLRSVAVEALISLKARDAAAQLANLFIDPSDRLRRDLIELMVSVDYREALPQIRQLLRDHSISVRTAALTAVQTWRDFDSLATIRWMAYSDNNPFVRPQALDCLVAFLGQGAIPDLNRLAGDVNSQVRQQALRHLENFTQRSDASGRINGAGPDFEPAQSMNGLEKALLQGMGSADSFSPEDSLKILWQIKTRIECQAWPVSPDLLIRLDAQLANLINLVEAASDEIRAGEDQDL